jgi:hypothetical protein
MASATMGTFRRSGRAASTAPFARGLRCVEGYRPPLSGESVTCYPGDK